MIDATDRSDGEVLSPADVEERLPRELWKLDIVLVRTGLDQFYRQPDYIPRGPGVSAEATRWLYEPTARAVAARRGPPSPARRS
jgi:kynurenine formamidase